MTVLPAPGDRAEDRQADLAPTHASEGTVKQRCSLVPAALRAPAPVSEGSEA
jgi:hypothetical protein